MPNPQMSRIFFWNLLANAIKYSYLSSEVFLISEQVYTTGTLNGKGTGPGLLIYKEFLEINMGNIGVSIEPGSGSLFWFSLPSRPA